MNNILPKYLFDATEQIDAAIFSGDVFVDDDYREEMQRLIFRWTRGLNGMKAISDAVKEEKIEQESNDE